MMKANYHAHTPRCGHARGTEREYVEAAVKAGIKIFGMADHSPYPLKEGYISGMRMRLEETEGYVRILEDLRQEYKDDIEIHIGLEAEYMPERFGAYLEFLKDYPIEYLILGQHMLDEDQPGARWCGAPTSDRSFLTGYVDQVLEGLKTGKFLYLAHPDLINYAGDNDFYRLEMRRLIWGAKALGVPLELNFLGLMENRNYPNPVFWTMVGEEGAPVVYGADAHRPENVFVPWVYDKAESWRKKYGFTVIPELDLSGAAPN